MWTTFSYRCLVVLVFAHFCSKSSEGAVVPCSKNDIQFRNRTLSARMGGTVSFTFCAKHSVRVFERVNISHPNHRSGWYPQPAGVEETLEVQVTIHHHTANIKIEVNKLQPADFNETFAVTLFAADVNGTRINDTATFFFVIEDTDNDTTILTTPSTPLTTDDGDTTQLLADLRNTTTTCAEQSNVIGRLDMCHVIDDICLTVFVGNINQTPRDQCAAVNTSHVADFNSIEILKPCLTGIAFNTIIAVVDVLVSLRSLPLLSERPAPIPTSESRSATNIGRNCVSNADLLQLTPVKIVRLGETKYIDTHNWSEVHQQSLPYRVPCLITTHKLVDPVITWFTLQPWDDQRETILWQHNLLDLNNTSVTIPATNNTLNVTCQASGYPTPEIMILRDNETLMMSPDGNLLQLNHTLSGEFLCQATNVLKSGSTHIRVLISTPESLNKPGDLFDNSTHSVTPALELGLCLILVVILLLFAFLYLRRRVNREHTKRDIIQGQVEVPMVATQTGSSSRRYDEYLFVEDSSYYSPPRPQ